MHYTLLGRAIDPQNRFKHVMALALNPLTNFEDGVIRCITDREGSVDISGFVDHSVLHTVYKTGPYSYEIGAPIHVAEVDAIIGPLMSQGFEFLGLEDPDLFVDDAGILHMYCTIPLINRGTGESTIYLGHASGHGLDAMTMREPVLMVADESAKEVSLMPQASDGICRHLIESSAPGSTHTAYSTIRIAKATAFDGPWSMGETVFHPAEQGVSWAGGHASPGPILPQSFINVGPGRVVLLMNGREADRAENNQVVFGMFSVGLAIYDYEHGSIVWVSPQPFIQDGDAKTITFASQFVETESGKGILYAHIDDSFVHAYTLEAEDIRAYLRSMQYPLS